MSNAPNALRIYVTRDRISKRGPLYSARLGSPDGDILATASMEPAFAAARTLIAKGFDPASILEMWDAERPYPRLQGQLGVMAKQTVLENEKIGPQFVKYRPFPNAVSRHAVSAKTGGQATGATELPPAALSSPATHREAA